MKTKVAVYARQSAIRGSNSVRQQMRTSLTAAKEVGWAVFRIANE
jgi:hypothetical protein